MAVLAFVLTIAPLASQAVMGAETHVHHGTAASVFTEHQHADQHSVAGHRHDTTAAKHSHHHAEAAGHTPDGGSPTPQHDHAGGPDSKCCGTYCHLVCAISALDGVRTVEPSGAFERLPNASVASIDPDLLQRPPSILLSV